MLVCNLQKNKYVLFFFYSVKSAPSDCSLIGFVALLFSVVLLVNTKVKSYSDKIRNYELVQQIMLSNVFVIFIYSCFLHFFSPFSTSRLTICFFLRFVIHTNYFWK